jgi:hypothetical protein
MSATAKGGIHIDAMLATPQQRINGFVQQNRQVGSRSRHEQAQSRQKK